MSFTKQAVTSAFSFKIHMAGNAEDAIRVCRKFCLSGACVQVWPCQYVYTGGLEDGFIVSLMNYARFPQDKETLGYKAIELAGQLAHELCQASFSIEGPDESAYYENKLLKDSTFKK